LGISQQIEAVYQRALVLRQRATASPAAPALLDEALRELYFVLEELQAIDSDLQQQNQHLIDAQQQLEVERQRYRTLFELAPDGYLVTDRQGKIHHANQVAAALFAAPQANLVGKPLVALVAPSDRSAVWAQLVHPAGQQDWEISLPRRGQPAVLVAISTAAIAGAQGQGLAILWSLRDISQRKQMEQQLQSAHNELEQRVESRTAELVKAQADLDRTQRLDSLGTLASGLAHDLSNTLTPVATGAELLLLPKYALGEAAYPLVQMIKTSTQRGIDLLRQLLLFAQGATGLRGALALDRVLTEVATLIRRTASAAIAVDTDLIAGESVWVEADPTQLQQVLMNLCLNACSAMAEGGTLSLAVEPCQIEPGSPLAPPGRYGVVTIADTGTGIDPSVIDSIFDPFFTTKASGFGTGLGLAIAFRIVQSHGGFIEVSSQLGKGSQFRVYLPAIAAPASASTPPAASAPLLEGEGQRVLIVDDNPTVGQSIEMLLEAYGYTPLMAPDGPTALALYEQGQTSLPPQAIDLVLLDIDMPAPDGLETLQRLLTLDPGAAVVVMSGSSRDHQEILARGAKAFLLKPYPIADILLTLNQALGQG
jgi:PAS domain S-box-containing protein